MRFAADEAGDAPGARSGARPRLDADEGTALGLELAHRCYWLLLLDRVRGSGRHLDDQGEDRVQIGREGYRDGHLGEMLRARDGRVPDGIRGQSLVGHEDACAVPRAQDGVREGDLLDRPLLILDDDLVADAQRLREGDENTGDEVRERPLRGEADDEADDGGRGKHASRDRADGGNDEKSRENAERHDRDDDRAPSDAVARKSLGREVEPPRDRTVSQAREHDGRHDYDPGGDRARPPLHARHFSAFAIVPASMARRLVLLAVTALVATACGERAEPLGILAQNYPVKVLGAGDRIAVLDRAPKRIVALDSGEAETLLALHVGTALVGAPAGTPGTSALTVVRPSGLVDVDSVVRLKPDLVVATSRTDPLDLDTVEHATRAAVYVAPDSSLRDVEDGTLDLGFLVGRPVDARRLVARIRADVDRVEARLAGAAPVTVFIDTGLFITAATRSLLGDLVHLAHGRSVAGPHPGDDPVSPRRIAELDPDIYLATSDSGVTLRGLRRDRAARKIPAVRAGHFAVVASELVNEPGPRVGEGLASVAKALHPDAFR